MIRSLRRRHLSVWLVFAMLVPVGVAIALAARTTVAPSDWQVDAQLGASFEKWTSQWEREAFFAELPISIALQHDSSGGWRLHIAATAELVQPDLLLYWVEKGAAELDSSARLMGAVSHQRAVDLPMAGELVDGGGELLLYSLAHGRVVSRAEWPGREQN